MTEANYSNNDYYHYFYDAVGNRETQQKSVLGIVTNDTYVYDDANRLTSLNGQTYTWDNNGNLLNDGVNTYTYDSANRLKTFSGQGNNVTYAYNGLNDRLQETVNGSTTTFTMDLNAGLTQALSDGTNTYIYGNGRIAQAAGTGTEYFLGDALGSVRQMTNQSSTINYAKAYDPYGVVTSTAGSSQSAYGFTSEYTDSYIKLIYLRSRMYSPADGRFTTKDSWQGDYNRPLSLNRWMYVEGDPINSTDPSGHFPTGPWCWNNFTSRADAAERYVNSTIDGHLIQDYLNTYTAAGMGVQCWGSDYNSHPLSSSGVGPAQVSIDQINTAYGADYGEYHAYGLRCWIGIQYKYHLLQNGIIVWSGDVPDCSICKTEDEMKTMDKDYLQHYQLEPPHNPHIPEWAVEYMRRRIKLVTDLCVSKGCSSTDLFIAAALAQNGPGFNRQNIIDLTVPKLRVNKGNATIDWWTYFGGPNNADDTRDQLVLFVGVIKELEKRRWYIPNVNWNTVDELSKIGD